MYAFKSEVIKLALLAPFINMKYEMAVIEKPPHRANIQFLVFLRSNENNNQVMY